MKKIFISLVFVGFANASYALDSYDSLSYDSAYPGYGRIEAGFTLYQPVKRDQQVNVTDGPFFVKSADFNDKSPTIGGHLRYYMDNWFAEIFISGPTSLDQETVIDQLVGTNNDNNFGNVRLDRTVYGGLKVGRDLFSINPFNPLDSFAFISSAESASYASSLAHEGLVIGLAGGFRVVGDELELTIVGNEAGRDVDDSVVIEPIAELYARLYLQHFILSFGAQAGLLEERSARVGFYKAKTEQDVDVNLNASISFPF